jgi:hypothetical protein
MQIPPNRVADYLAPYSDTLDLRDPSGRLLSRLTYTHAIALATRGEIEAIANKSGKIRYFRVLPESLRPEQMLTDQAIAASRSTAIAQTNIGAYLQRLSTTRVWAFSLLRGSGL